MTKVCNFLKKMGRGYAQMWRGYVQMCAENQAYASSSLWISPDGVVAKA